MACINAVSFHEDPDIESICRRIAATGFDTIEVSRPPFYHKLITTGVRQRFADWVQTQGLKLYGFDCWVDVLPYDQMQATVDQFSLAIKFAADLDLGMVISHDPWEKDHQGRSPSECLKANIELFQRVADQCAAANLDLVFEPHPDTLSMQNDWCIDFIDGLRRKNVGVLYDCCHYGVGQPEGYVDSIRTLGHRIRHIHFSDGDRQTYALHLPLGDGTIQLDAVVQALQSIKYAGTLTCDLYNYPLLDDGAKRNIEGIRDVERQLGLVGQREP